MNKEFILLTGATGFIGSHVAGKILDEKTYALVTVARKDSHYKNVDDLKQKGAIVIGGSFFEKKLIENTFKQFPISIVIHMAALRGAGSGTKDDYTAINVTATEALLDASLKHKVKKFIFCSSVGVYGTIPQELPAGPATKLQEDTEYHRSKILAEKKVLEYIAQGLNAYIIRPTIAYGRQDNGFPRTLVELVRRRAFFLSIPDIKLHLLDVDSLAHLVYEMAQSNRSEQRVFIVADRSPVSLKELTDVIHYYFYQKKYPFYLKLPKVFFRMLAAFFKLLRWHKWVTRISLISEDWYYDIRQTTKAFDFKPSNTKDCFMQKMGV